MHTLAGDPIEVDGQGRGEGLSLAGLHFRNPAEVQGGTADQLHVVVTLTEHPLRCFPDGGEGFDQEIVDRFPLVESTAELPGLGLQRIIGQRFELGFERVDVGHQGLERLQLAPLAASQNTGEDGHGCVVAYRPRTMARSAVAVWSRCRDGGAGCRGRQRFTRLRR